MGFASYFERICELADESGARDAKSIADDVMVTDRTYSWSPHYRDAKPKPPVRSRMARRLQKLSPQDKERLDKLMAAASEFVEAKSMSIQYFSDKQNGRAARKRFKQADKNFRVEIRLMYAHIIARILLERKKINNVCLIYLVDQIIRAGDGFFDVPFRSEAERIERHLHSARRSRGGG